MIGGLRRLPTCLEGCLPGGRIPPAASHPPHAYIPACRLRRLACSTARRRLICCARRRMRWRARVRCRTQGRTRAFSCCWNSAGKPAGPLALPCCPHHTSQHHAGRRTGKTLQHARLLLGRELLEAGDAAGAERLLTEVAGAAVPRAGVGRALCSSAHCSQPPCACWLPPNPAPALTPCCSLLPAGAVGGAAGQRSAAAARVPPAHARPAGGCCCLSSL